MWRNSSRIPSPDPRVLAVRFPIILLMVLVGFFGVGARALASDGLIAPEIADAVVKIYVTSNPMDYSMPWQSAGSGSQTGSGCVLPGGRIITNAHVVTDHTFIQVRKQSSPKKYTARVEAIGHDCDLALITVDDPAFFEDITPLEFGDLPQLQDSVSVIGFPMGGDKQSFTKGVVSRIEVVPYAQTYKPLLAVQIDAAINPGNSGGPVIQNGKLVGVAMQLIASSQNIGFMIPMPIIQHFLNDLKDGVYHGFPSLGIDFSNAENDALREFYRISGDDGGIVVSGVLPFSPANSVLQKDDILLTVDGIRIDPDGTFPFRQNERLDFSHLVTQKQIGESISFHILRQGKVIEKTITFSEFKALVAPPRTWQRPPYYIYGGLVFTVLSMDLLQTWGNEWWARAPTNFLYYTFGTGRQNIEKKGELVVLLAVLPDDINIGYTGIANEIITSVNDQGFSDFKEFVRLVESSRADFMVFKTDRNQKIILKTKGIEAINQDILTRNTIPAKQSEHFTAKH